MPSKVKLSIARFYHYLTNLLSFLEKILCKVYRVREREREDGDIENGFEVVRGRGSCLQMLVAFYIYQVHNHNDNDKFVVVNIVL